MLLEHIYTHRYLAVQPHFPVKNKSTAGASPGFGRGGQKFVFTDFGICMSGSDMLRMAKPCALLGGLGACSPRKFFKTMQFGAF